MRQLLIVLIALLLPASAGAYTFATDTGDDTGNPLRWSTDGDPIPVRQHHLGGGELPAWLIHSAARNAMQSWVEVREASFSFKETSVYFGVPCPHAIPTDDLSLIEQVCGGPMPDHDFLNALYFIETVWPFGEEVIALTTLSWSEGGVLVDADISYNGLDYGWTVFDDVIDVDVESITLHEMGHFLGLGHSQEIGAVMRIDYQEGTLARVLGSDDAAGVAQLYPCNSGNCIGQVTHDAPDKCDMASAGRGGLVGLSLVLVAVAWRRRSSAAAALAGLGLMLVPLPATTSTVAALDVTDLADRADRVVRGTVAAVTPYSDRLVRSEIEIEVAEDWKGGGARTIVLDQPGGLMPDGSGTRVFGMPRFEAGDEVVLFLAEHELVGTRVLGLAQGAFEVQTDGTVSRDLSGLLLARVGGHRAPDVVKAPRTVEELRAAVQGP